jgi:hypothetical protein
MTPCAISPCEHTKAYSFVVKTDTFGPIQAFGAAALVNGAGAVAQVQMPSGECYFVLTDSTPRSIQYTATKLAADIRKLPAAPTVEWVRPLTVRLQRLFAWGDVTATRQDVERAVAKEDTAELRAMLPQAARLIDDGDTEMLSVPPMHSMRPGGSWPLRTPPTRSGFTPSTRLSGGMCGPSGRTVSRFALAASGTSRTSVPVAAVGAGPALMPRRPSPR